MKSECTSLLEFQKHQRRTTPDIPLSEHKVSFSIRDSFGGTLPIGKAYLRNVKDGFDSPHDDVHWILDEHTTCYPLTPNTSGPVKLLGPDF